MFKVLSIDGGGIRGVFAARFLQRCEELWGPLHKVFDLITGTSTGGIIALAAAYEKRMADVVELYSAGAQEIFPSRGKRPPNRISKCLTLLKSVVCSKYDNRPLIRILKSIFGTSVSFDVPSCPVRIQSFDLETGSSKIFRAGAPYVEDAQYRIWEVAAATSAAPTYFPTFEIPNKGMFVDGGVWANNPAFVGIVEALILHQRLDDVCILSVGTGGKIFRDNAVRTGFWSWGSDLVELVFRSQSDGVDQLVQGLEIKHLGCYKRISEILKPSESGMDATHATQILCKLADQKFAREKGDVGRRFFS